MKKSILSILFVISMSASYASEPSERRVYLKGDNKDFSCNFSSIIRKTYFNGGDLADALKKTSFSPCCFPQGVHRILDKQTKVINGLTIGTDESIAKFVGQTGGLELVFVKLNEKEMQVGLIGFSGGAAGFGLGDITPVPVSLGVTRGILHGSCHSLYDYLGSFLSIEVAGQQKSMGLTMTPLSLNAQKTGCNSDQVVIGTTSELIGGSTTNYKKFSEFVRVKGPRVNNLLKMINNANSDSELRRKLNPKSSYLFGGIQETLEEMLAMGFEEDLRTEIPMDLKQYQFEKYMQCSPL